MSEEKPKRMAIIASKGTLDMAYPPLILASTAAAMDVETMIFYTFYGVDIVNKHKFANLKVAPIANPAMPSPGSTLRSQHSLMANSLPAGRVTVPLVMTTSSIASKLAVLPAWLGSLSMASNSATPTRGRRSLLHRVTGDTSEAPPTGYLGIGSGGARWSVSETSLSPLPPL
jgi:peroxiredoxin family protein